MTVERYGLRLILRAALRWALPVLAVGAAVTGCVSAQAPTSSHATPAKAKVTACDLLTVAAIKALTGAQLGAGRQGPERRLYLQLGAT